jgi:LacI family transcriptional regulator
MVRKKKNSIYTVGEELGISPGTVPRVLNNHPFISAKTRARVKPLAEKYHFKPRLMSTRLLNLCLLIEKVPNHPLGIDEYVALTMEGVAEYCQEEKLEMSIYSGDVEALNRSDIIRELRLRTVNGAIILRATDESTYLQQMYEQRFPYFSLTPCGKKISDRELTLDYEQLGDPASALPRSSQDRHRLRHPAFRHGQRASCWLRSGVGRIRHRTGEKAGLCP